MIACQETHCTALALLVLDVLTIVFFLNLCFCLPLSRFRSFQILKVPFAHKWQHFVIGEDVFFAVASNSRSHDSPIVIGEDVYPTQQPYTASPIFSQGNIPPKMGAQPYTHQSYPQYQSSPFATPTGQTLPQTLHYQPQYQSPAGFQPSPSPQIFQPSSLESLEMAKLKAESELQHSRLMEYEVASEHSEHQKTRLEEEVKELMKKVQEMEGVRHKKDLDATSKASELEGKVISLSYFI